MSREERYVAYTERLLERLQDKNNEITELQEELKEERRLPVKMNYATFFILLIFSPVTAFETMVLILNLLGNLW